MGGGPEEHTAVHGVPKSEQNPEARPHWPLLTAPISAKSSSASYKPQSFSCPAPTSNPDRVLTMSPLGLPQVQHPCHTWPRLPPSLMDSQGQQHPLRQPRKSQSHLSNPILSGSLNSVPPAQPPARLCRLASPSEAPRPLPALITPAFFQPLHSPSALLPQGLCIPL